MKSFESRKLVAYLCPAGEPTIGWGHTASVTADQVGVRRITAADAEALLAADLAGAERLVNERVKAALNQNQFDALVSFVFNMRNPKVRFTERQCTLLRLLNQGRYSDAAAQFSRWVFAMDPKTGRKRVLGGLVRRRAAEADLFLEAAA